MSKYRIAYTSRLKKQCRLLGSRGFNIAELDNIITMLASGNNLPGKYRDHVLQGTRTGYKDGHIRPGWILIYKIEEDVLILLLCETETHANLFK
jgi:mRNA interferase YafQ